MSPHHGFESSSTVVELSLAKSRSTHRLMGQLEYRIGSGEFCDLILSGDGVPLLHSVLHVERDCVWLETSDSEFTFQIDGNRYHRLALRSGDRVELCNETFDVQLCHNPLDELMGILASCDNDERSNPADISRLSAADLCTRLEEEIRMIAELESDLDDKDDERSFSRPEISTIRLAEGRPIISDADTPNRAA